MTGTVIEFDAQTGLGVLEATGGARLAFHCTQVIDGSGSLKAGTRVHYAVIPGGVGVWEAGAVELLSS